MVLPARAYMVRSLSSRFGLVWLCLLVGWIRMALFPMCLALGFAYSQMTAAMLKMSDAVLAFPPNFHVRPALWVTESNQQQHQIRPNMHRHALAFLQTFASACGWLCKAFGVPRGHLTSTLGSAPISTTARLRSYSRESKCGFRVGHDHSVV